MKDFGTRLRDLRMKYNESQKDLADYFHVSFQSISKWEQGIHYPDVFTINKLSEHYQVRADYFFDTTNNQTKTETFPVSVNKENTICVWTDFLVNDTMAPTAILDEHRHRAGNGVLKTHPGPKDTIVLAVNKDHLICFIGEHKDDRVPSCGPQGDFYHQTKEGGRNNPCFIIEDTFLERKRGDRENIHEKDFEFVIPQSGFLMTIPKYSIYAKQLLCFILPKAQRKFVEKNYPNLRNWHGQSLFGNMLLSDELNHCRLYLRGSELVIEKDGAVDNDESGDSQLQDLKETIDSLEDRIDELQMKIDDLESRIDDVESRCDDIESN